MVCTSLGSLLRPLCYFGVILVLQRRETGMALNGDEERGEFAIYSLMTQHS